MWGIQATTFVYEIICPFTYLMEYSLLKVLDILGVEAYAMTHLDNNEVRILHSMFP